MARKRYKPEAERIPEAAGLQTTQPPIEESEPVSEEVFADEPVLPVDDPAAEVKPEVSSIDMESPVIVSSTIPTDPDATIAACLLAIGRIYNDMGVVSAAISKHLPRLSGDIEMHAFMLRVQTNFGEFIHHQDQIESSLSERVREEIADGLAG